MSGFPRSNVAERFWKRVLVGGPDECWPFLGALNADLYGVFRVDRDEIGLVYAHRLSYCLVYGPIPDGLEILHKCRVRPRLRSCCNPRHLIADTHAANCQDLFDDRKKERRGRCWGAAKRLTVAA